ncbi:MAG: PAS domain S-box protein [Limisphaerales bacterium]
MAPADFEAIFQGSPNLYLVITPEFRIVAATDAYLAATKTLRAQVLGRDLFEAFPDDPEDPKATGVANLRASLEKVLLEKKPHLMPVQKYSIRRPQAEGGGFEERYWSPRNSPVLSGNGEVLYIIHQVEDVTQQYRAEQESLESEARFRTLADESPLFIWMADAQANIIYANRTFLHYAGLRGVDELSGRKWRQIVAPEDLSKIHEVYSNAVQEEKLTELELRFLQAATGVYRWHLVKAVPRFVSGRFVGFMGTAVDIHDRILVQKALSQSEARYRELAATLEQQVKDRTAVLGETNRHLEAFTYTIAHDLRGPLRAQQGFANLLLADYGDVLGETGREYAGRIVNAAKRLNDLVNDLLTYSRISRTEMTLERLDVHKIISAICAEMAFDIREANAKVQLNSLDACVLGHYVTFRTAIGNLISNAIKFSRPGVPPELRIYGEDREGQWRIWFEDKGIGIAPEYHHQIFGVFHRLHPQGQYPGTGVGLAIVQKGLERMGGRVGLESEEGRGSRFWIELEKCR